MRLPHFGMMTMLLAGGLFAVMPTSSSYQLNNYGFGSGGTGNSTSTNYGLNATTGQPTSGQNTSTNYTVRSGNNQSQQAYVPVAPSFTNPSNYYNKLLFTVNPSASPSDTKFTIAISTDNFTTTNYVQLDDTIGSTKVYQTYSAWGGAGGQLVIGLSPSTTYQIKANAIQGNFTETEYGPSASAATVAPSISFEIDVSAIDTTSSPPYAVTLPTLLPASVITSNQKIWISLTTNAASGAGVYIRSTNAGLKSTAANYTIASASADLAVAASGYGAEGSSATQGSGGPLTLTSPYNGAGQNVGILDATLRQLFSSSSPVTSGRGSIQLKAKAATSTPAAGDYADTLVLTTAGTF